MRGTMPSYGALKGTYSAGSAVMNGLIYLIGLIVIIVAILNIAGLA